MICPKNTLKFSGHRNAKTSSNEAPRAYARGIFLLRRFAASNKKTALNKCGKNYKL
jgi:hypothetical protein